MKEKTNKQLLEEIENLKANIRKFEKNKEYAEIIAENTTDNIAITTFDLKAKYLYVSPSVRQVLDYNPEDLIGRSFFEFIHPDDKKIIFSLLKKYISQIIKKVLRIDDPNLSETLEFRFIDKSGNWHYMQSTVNFIGNNLLTVTRDISERKNTEAKLLQRENYLSALNQSKEILLTCDKKNAFQQFVDILGKASSASRTYIFINHTGENGEALVSQKAEFCLPGIKPEINNPDLQNLSYDEFFSRWNNSLSNGEIIFGKIKDFPVDEKEFLEIQDIKAILIIPIMTNNKFIGFIGFDNCNSEREWDTAEQDFLKVAANDLAQFIELNKIQEQLVAENMRFHATMDALDAIVYVADMQTHELIYLNELGKKITGSNIGTKCYNSLQKEQSGPCDFCTNHLLLDETGNPKEPHVWEFQNTMTNRWYQLRDKAIHWPDGRIVRLEIATDITERKNAETDLKLALGKAEESDKLKTAFLQNISHEIRTPMNGILGFIDLLKTTNLGAVEQQSYIDIIKLSSMRMLNTINDLMDISMIETDQMKLNLSLININTELNNLLNFFKPEVTKKGMKLSLSTSLPTIDVNIRTDNDKFYAILSNLIKNSIKYSNEGSIEFGYEKKGDELEFYVKDTGIGIPQARLDAIFDRFVQADIEDIKVWEGVGLGLSICKAYIEMLDGNIWVESKEGVGTQFYFTIPFNRVNEKQPKGSIKNLNLTTGKQAKKLNILIAEDEEFAFEYLTIILDEISTKILHTTTGIETVNICRENPDIDLILMDHKMPGMSGYKATKIIREFNKDVIIIAQTAYALIGDREKALKAGCDDYISKPIDRNKLINMITKLISG